MLRFFRTICEKLIEQDNVRKYLLYAIGEFLLVVIGSFRPIKDVIGVETRKSPNNQRAGRPCPPLAGSGLLDSSHGNRSYGVPTARGFLFSFQFLPICSPYGTDPISEITNAGASVPLVPILS